jgi:hypothetical protein
MMCAMRSTTQIEDEHTTSNLSSDFPSGLNMLSHIDLGMYTILSFQHCKHDLSNGSNFDSHLLNPRTPGQACGVLVQVVSVETPSNCSGRQR